MSRRMKLDKNFKPHPTEPGDERFPNGIFDFNVTKMLAHIKMNPNEYTIEMVEAEHLVGNTKCLIEETVLSADLTAPIILAEVSPGRFNVIDGNHRLEKAKRKGVKLVPAYRVRAEQHVGFLTTEQGYIAYVEYWNSKLAANI